VFRPTDAATARDALGLPRDRPIVLFIAEALTNRRKGAAVLVEPVKNLAMQGKDLGLVSVGGASLPAPAGFTYAAAILGRPFADWRALLDAVKAARNRLESLVF
jgi:hypothetical protein